MLAASKVSTAWACVGSADLMDTDVDDYEMVIFDGGNTSGDTWKHVFFPRQREHYFVYQA